MAKKGKKSAKKGMSKQKRTKTKQKVSGSPRAAATSSSVSKAKVIKTHEELEVLRKKFAATISANAAGACFFKDPSGGPDQCIPATQDDCKSEGGVWTPGNCPSFTSSTEALALSKGIANVMKTHGNLETLRKKFAATISANAAGACFFKDPSGGPDQCIPATQEDCKSEGGVWSPGNCPN